MTGKATVVRYGNTWAIELDEGVVDELRLSEGASLQVETRGNTMMLTTSEALAAEEVSFEKALEDFNARYGRMLKRLA